MSYIGNLPRTQKGGRVAIATVEAGGESTLAFVNGAAGVVLDSTYDSYEWHFVNLHPSADSKKLEMIASTNAGSSYGIATMTSVFSSYHGEDGSNPTLSYNQSTDSAQSTSEIIIGDSTGYDADQSCSGFMILYNPGSSTYSKNFMAQIHQSSGGNFANNTLVTGYINTTSPVDAIRFSFDVGNLDLGKIYMYGVNNA